MAPGAVIVLDGASQPGAAERDGGWLAETLGTALCERLAASPDIDLGDLLAEAIAATARRHGLTPGAAPSTTVSVVKWYDDKLDALVLGDSPVIVATSDLCLSQLRDDRLSHVAAGERQAFRECKAGLFGTERPQEWRNLLAVQRMMRNKPGGYWIAEAVPRAALYALRNRWSLADISAVMVMTDGVASGVDRYGVPGNWHDALKMARRQPSELVDIVHLAEKTDNDGIRWPRSKRHDDKALAVVDFAADDHP